MKRDPVAFHEAGKSPRIVVVARDASERDCCAEGTEISGDVCGTTGSALPVLDTHDRNRRLRRNATRGAEPVLVQHQVANNESANCPEIRNPHTH